MKTHMNALTVSALIQIKSQMKAAAECDGQKMRPKMTRPNHSFLRTLVTCCLLSAAVTTSMAQEIKTQKIRLLDWSMLGDGPGTDELAAVCTSVMAHSQDGMGKAWLDRIAKTKRVDGLLDFGHIEKHIRPAAHSSRTLALALRLGQYRADKAGAKASEIEMLLPLVVRSLANDHKVNGGLGDKAWGDQWQSAMWAAQTDRKSVV